MLDLTLAESQKIKLVAENFDVAPLADALARNPQLWDEHTGRTEHPDSPHFGCSDIWVRFAAKVGESGAVPHFSEWYPSANVLPMREIARELMYATGATVLGGILITRIPPRWRVRPHIDEGWHARSFSKVAVQVKAAPEQTYCFDGESLVTKPGDLFTFDNAYLHSVTNDSDVERITAIFCMRIER